MYRAPLWETEELPGFDAADYEAGGNGWAGKDGDTGYRRTRRERGEHRQVLPGKVDVSAARTIIDKIRAAKRPVINAGNGIRIAGAHDLFMDVAEKLGVPVITGWDSEDIMYDTHPCTWAVQAIWGQAWEFCHSKQRPGALHWKPSEHPAGGI